MRRGLGVAAALAQVWSCGAFCISTYECRVDSPVAWNGDTECESNQCRCTEPLYGHHCEFHLQHEHPVKFNLLFRGFTVLHGLLAGCAVCALARQAPKIAAGHHAVLNVASVVTLGVVVSQSAATVYTGAAHGFQARGYWFLSWRVLYAMWGLSPAATLFALDVVCIFWHYSLAANKKIQHAALPRKDRALVALAANLVPACYLSFGLEFGSGLGGVDPYWIWIWLNASWHALNAALLSYVTLRIASVVAHLKGAMRRVAFRAGKGCEIPNFKGSYLGRFPLVLADFWTSDHLWERSRP